MPAPAPLLCSSTGLPPSSLCKMAGAALAVARRSSCYATALGVARVSKDGPPCWTAKQGQPTGLEEC